ncbi:hypothetical protein FOZ63_012358, partial [Perkinsus olseni]
FDLIHHQNEMDLPGRYVADGSGETRECWSGEIAGPSDGALLGKGKDILAELSLEGAGAETWGHTPLTGTVYSISMLWEADFHTAVTHYLVAQESASEEAARASALRIVRCASERMLCYLLKIAILVADAAVVEEMSSAGNMELFDDLASDSFPSRDLLSAAAHFSPSCFLREPQCTAG